MSHSRRPKPQIKKETWTNSNLKNSIVAVVLVAVTASSVFAQQQARQSNDAFLRVKSKRLHNHSADLGAFVHATTGDERDFVFLLRNVVQDTQERLSAAETLLEIYDNLSCREDRENAWKVIRRDLDYYAKDIDSDILTVNKALPYLKAPAVATSGTQLKEDLRELKAFFESIRPKREGEK